MAACRHPEATHPPIPAPCTADRVGSVEVLGGSPDDVPQLVVLAGTLDNPARTDRVAQVSAELLRGRGYPQAAVTVSRRQGCGVDLVVAVDKGPKFQIAAIRFATDDGFPALERVAALEDGLGMINTVGGAYVEARMLRALDRLTRRYHELGWLEAEIDPPQAAFDAARGEVTVTIAVRAGQRYKIGNVTARGGARTTRAAVLEALGLRGGQWYDATRLREGIVRARRELGMRLEMRMALTADRIDLEAVLGDTP